MTTLSTATTGDKRPRATRIAPRRHIDPAEAAEMAQYDGGEFPVLLRLPDILLEPGLTSERQQEREISREEGSATEVDPSPQARRRHQKRQSRSDESLRRRITAMAAHRFWGGVAPRVAAGGMLLAVTAICVVLLQGPRSSAGPSSDGSSQWANESPLQSTPRGFPGRGSDSHSEAESPRDELWPTRPNSIAAKPQTTGPLAPQTGTTARNETLSGAVPPPALVTPPDHSPNQDGGTLNQWPTRLPGSSPASHGSPVRSDQKFQAQGWPDDAGPSHEPASGWQAPELNSAAMAQPNPGYRAAREILPAWNSPAPPSNLPAWNSQSPPSQLGGARLNGTVEIPNPAPDYRR